MRRAVIVFSLFAVCLMAGAVRSWNLRDVFVEGRVYFVDADCYSRMTRARQVANGEALIIRHHDFENWPKGVRPHTTAPMDWAIVAAMPIADCGLRIGSPITQPPSASSTDWGKPSLLRGQALDVAGAIVSPLIGVLTCLFLGVWALRLQLPGWLAPPFFFAISPILVHGTLLGRPDHQSLLIALLTVALAAELALARKLTRGWGTVAGVAWALALWVSLYEPLVLVALVVVFWLVRDRRRFALREMRAGWLAFVALLAAAWLIDGWRISVPDAALRSAFANWEKTIGELAHLDPRAPLLYRWVGFGILLAPIALVFTAVVAYRRGENATFTAAMLAFVLLAGACALTIWQLRWGYFLAAIFALSLPCQFAAAPRVWIAWPVFLLVLWPIAQDWDEKLFPEDHPEMDLETKRSLLRLEGVRLREVAERMRSADRRPFLAPWWLSPALAYWSGQPGVAGSSHESLPGIVATARFFLAPDAAEAERIAREAGVKWIITDDPDRLVATSQTLLGVEKSAVLPYVAHLHQVAEPRERVSAEDLRSATPEARAKLIELADRAEAAQLGSAAFSCISTNQFYKLFSAKGATQPP